MRIHDFSMILALAIAAPSLACAASPTETTPPQTAEASASTTPTEGRHEESFEQTDDQITAAVSARLRADPESRLHTIDVVTAAGVVTLSGTVDSAGTRNVASFIAKDIRGVAGVVNEIAIDEVAPEQK